MALGKLNSHPAPTEDSDRVRNSKEGIPGMISGGQTRDEVMDGESR